MPTIARDLPARNRLLPPKSPPRGRLLHLTNVVRASARHSIRLIARCPGSINTDPNRSFGGPTSAVAHASAPRRPDHELEGVCGSSALPPTLGHERVCCPQRLSREVLRSSAPRSFPLVGRSVTLRCKTLSPDRLAMGVPKTLLAPDLGLSPPPAQRS